MAAFKTRTFSTGTAFTPEDDGVWTFGDYTGDGTSDLIYIKTRNTGTNTVEVHVASGASNYKNFIEHTGTAFALEDNGVWTMADTTGDGHLDLIYIKTRNTGTNTVEVHVASGASNYKNFIEHTGTAFALEDDGVWTMADTTGDGHLDLIYIKTRNTGTNTVEVHVASGASNYKKFIEHTGTTFALEDNGVWTMADMTGDGKPDLVFIKTRNTGTRTVEVHVSSAASRYQQRTFSTGTTFLEENNGTWLMSKYTRNGVPHLVYIKTKNTGTGRVEAHIASS